MSSPKSIPCHNPACSEVGEMGSAGGQPVGWVADGWIEVRRYWCSFKCRMQDLAESP